MAKSLASTKASKGSPGDEPVYLCAIERSIDIIGGRWKAIILFHLMEGTRRFGELQRLVPAVTQQMLTQQLRELETDGIVHREVYKQVPPKVEYSLTKRGETLVPILTALCEWGASHAAETT